MATEATAAQRAALLARLSKPDTAAGQLQRALIRVLGEHVRDGMLPTSGQFLWYELEQRGDVDKNRRRGKPGVKRGQDQDLNAALTQLREWGIVPWEWIADETRSLYMYGGHATLAAGLAAQLATLRLDPWGAAPVPIILCESRSLAGVLTPIARDYCCGIAATNGQTRGFLHTKVGAQVAGRPVLYFGDWDLQGGQIEAHTRRRLAPYRPCAWGRVALTEQQVQDYALPVIEKVDQRYKDQEGARPSHPAVETEALGQRRIIALLRAHLDARLPAPLADVQVRETAEREELARLLGIDGERPPQ